MKSDKFFNKVYIIMATIMSFLTFTFLIAMGGDKIRGDLRDASIVSVVVGFITGAMLASVIDSMKNTECEAYLKTHSFIERAWEEKVPSGVYAVFHTSCYTELRLLCIRRVKFVSGKAEPAGEVLHVAFTTIPGALISSIDDSADTTSIVDVEWVDGVCDIRVRSDVGEENTDRCDLFYS